ncbi:MAG: Yip1 domain protein [candidate division WS6 bacterium OLB20]|uniref:Yip1 domain protein n=1 Tax=candidate division WS6 bacterium OLB20 TaxID=1617426 RepID=A0A136LZ35_9BACT|nr:MAG: Yip1 domain protein [candidate division WS6 bacterium OLB20]
MSNYFTYILNPSTYKSLSGKMSAKFVIILYLISSAISGIAQVLLMMFSDDPSYDQLNELFGGAGVAFSIIGFIIALIIGLAITVVMYVMLAFFSQALISSNADKPTLREVLRIYIFAYLPNILIGLIISLITAMFVPFIAIAPGFEVVYGVVSLVLGCVAIIAGLWSIYLLVASIQSRYSTSTGNALVSGCLPMIALYICIFVCILVSAFGFAALLMSSYSTISY